MMMMMGEMVQREIRKVDKIQGIEFFEELDEFLNGLSILYVVVLVDDKVRGHGRLLTESIMSLVCFVVALGFIL